MCISCKIYYIALANANHVIRNVDETLQRPPHFSLLVQIINGKLLQCRKTPVSGNIDDRYLACLDGKYALMAAHSVWLRISPIMFHRCHLSDNTSCITVHHSHHSLWDTHVRLGISPCLIMYPRDLEDSYAATSFHIYDVSAV